MWIYFGWYSPTSILTHSFPNFSFDVIVLYSIGFFFHFNKFSMLYFRIEFLQSNFICIFNYFSLLVGRHLSSAASLSKCLQQVGREWAEIRSLYLICISHVGVRDQVLELSPAISQGVLKQELGSWEWCWDLKPSTLGMGSWLPTWWLNCLPQKFNFFPPRVKGIPSYPALIC